MGPGLYSGRLEEPHFAVLQCCLACHKKCLETLAIQCGHKKLQGRLQLFGQDFSHAARSTPDGVPFIVKKCVCEIERRALHTKVRPWDGKGDRELVQGRLETDCRLPRGSTGSTA